jgi:hypothetical protein
MQDFFVVYIRFDSLLLFPIMGEYLYNQDTQDICVPGISRGIIDRSSSSVFHLPSFLFSPCMTSTKQDRTISNPSNLAQTKAVEVGGVQENLLFLSLRTIVYIPTPLLLFSLFLVLLLVLVIVALGDPGQITRLDFFVVFVFLFVVVGCGRRYR